MLLPIENVGNFKSNEDNQNGIEESKSRTQNQP